MKNNGISALLWGLSILLQWFCMKNNMSSEYELPFFSALRPADSASGNLVLTLYSMIPFPFLLLFFSGKVQDLTQGYGKLLIVRNYSKERLILELLGKTAATIALAVLLTGCIFSVLGEGERRPLGNVNILTGILMYGLTIFAIVAGQYCLELYMEASHANVFVIVAATVMLFISGSLGEDIPSLNLILFPNLAFAQKNGVVSVVGQEGHLMTSFMVIVVISAIFSGFLLKRFREKDIM